VDTKSTDREEDRNAHPAKCCRKDSKAVARLPKLHEHPGLRSR
jgi:hypothetical protein